MHQGTAAELCVRLRPPFLYSVCVCVLYRACVLFVCVCFTGRRRVSACIRAQLQNCVYASDHHFCTLCVCVFYREKESERMHQVLQHPVFKANPLQAITNHLKASD